MEGARIAIFEDDANWQDIASGDLSAAGHTVVAQATTNEEAVKAIDGLEADALDVAVVDGNLDKRRSDGADGARVAQLVREKFPTARIIGFSATGTVVGADYQTSKTGALDELTSIVASI